MRVYEIAKEAGVTSAEVLQVAEKAGVEVSSAISSVEDSELAALKLALATAPKTDVAARRAEKIRRAADLNASFFAAQKVKGGQYLIKLHLRILIAAGALFVIAVQFTEDRMDCVLVG